MIDMARTFIGKETLEKVIEGLAIAKMNVLHIHLTDSESFPLELESFPEVT